MISASARLQIEQLSSGSELAKAKTVKLTGAAAAAATWSSEAVGVGRSTSFGGGPFQPWKHVGAVQCGTMIEGSLEVKLPTVSTHEKAKVGRVREEKRREGKGREEKRRDETRREEKVREEKESEDRRQKMQAREKVEKSRNTVFYLMICGSGGSKSRLAKAAGAEQSGQMRDEKQHAIVARSTFRSQNVQNTSAPKHF